MIISRKYRGRIIAGVWLMVVGAAILVIVPLGLKYAAELVSSGQGNAAALWRILWNLGLILGFGAYLSIFIGIIIILASLVLYLKTKKTG